jgi:phosphate transport system substrate-binding protein
MSAKKRRRTKHPEAVLTCALLASSAPVSPAAATAATMNGGGSTLGGETLAGSGGEFALFNETATKAVFGTFWVAGSGPAQKAVINNDLTCDIDAVTEYNGGACTGSDGGANAVDYALAEETLSSTQIATWATSSFGQAAASNLIQIPAFGIAPAIVVNDTNITTNGELELSDNDLCGIFSGRITDFSQITDSSTAPAAGKFNLVYRTDANVMSFLLTNHLNAVCTTRNTHPGVSFTATTTFASLFPGGINSIIPDAVGEAGDAGVANYLSGLTSAGAIPQAIGYVSTGWTSLYPDSQAVLSNGEPSTLLVAALETGKIHYQPTIANVTEGLLKAKAGTGVNVTPPTNATEGANPALWVPVVPVVSKGYPIVGYTEFVLAQCYQTAAVGKGVVAFLKDHYGNAAYQAIQNANGFVTLDQVKANKFLKTIDDNILANDDLTNGDYWNINIGNPTACAGLEGR